MKKTVIASALVASLLSTHAVAANLTAYTTEWQILRSPTHGDETQTCNTLGTAACAAAQLNSKTGQK